MSTFVLALATDRSDAATPSTSRCARTVVDLPRVARRELEDRTGQDGQGEDPIRRCPSRSMRTATRASGAAGRSRRLELAESAVVARGAFGVAAGRGLLLVALPRERALPTSLRRTTGRCRASRRHVGGCDCENQSLHRPGVGRREDVEVLAALVERRGRLTSLNPSVTAIRLSSVDVVDEECGDERLVFACTRATWSPATSVRHRQIVRAVHTLVASTTSLRRRSSRR